MKKSSLPIPFIVKKIIKENAKTKTFITNYSVKAKPGQFIMLWVPGLAEKPFSLTTADPLSFTIMKVGKLTKYLNQKVRVGDKLWYRGPFGNGVFKKIKGKKLLVAGGCGSVPLYFLASTIKDKKTARMIVGAKSKKELLFVNRFQKLGFRVIISTEDGSRGIKGFTTDLLENILKKEKISCVYACGPNPMLKKIVKICSKYKSEYQVSLESLIKCGFGICGSCVCGSKLVCQDGPVFSRWPENDD